MKFNINGPSQKSLNRLALSATVHCLTGCSIGEILGMVMGTNWNWNNLLTITVSIVLAFFFGYSLTLIPLLRSKLAVKTALKLALAADTLSILVMEIIDNAIMLIIPGAMEAGLNDPFFWITLLFSLLVAGIAAFPINRWLIIRGRGHSLVHHHTHNQVSEEGIEKTKIPHQKPEHRH